MAKGPPIIKKSLFGILLENKENFHLGNAINISKGNDTRLRKSNPGI